MSEHGDDRSLLIQLHGVLSEIDPVRWHDAAAQPLKSRLTDLRRRLGQRERLAALAGELQVNLDQIDSKTQTADLRSRWLAFKKSFQPAYEAMAARFRAEKIHVPSLRPTNWARSAFHVGSAMAALIAIEVLSPTMLLVMATIWASLAWAFEFSRRRSPAINRVLMKAFKPVAHAHEMYRINSATWYATALVLLASLQNPVVAVVGVSILGIGDPMAGLIGRRFGRIKLIHGRSLEGTLSFFVSGFAVSFGLLALIHPSVMTSEALVIAAVASLFGAVAELFSLRLDDNLSVPVASALGAMLVMLVF